MKLLHIKEKIKMTYWLEKTYPSKRVREDFTSILLSPTTAIDGKNIYENMKRVVSGDIVFHLNQDSNALVGYSQATDNYDTIQIDGEDYLTVNLQDYQSLPLPINIDSFLSNPANQNLLIQVKQEHEVFYQEKNNKFYIKQGGYLTKLDPRLVELFGCHFDNTQPATPVIEDDEVFSEGRTKYRVHKHKERSKKLINAAKKHFKEHNNGKLFCEACGFDFVETYGSEIGEGFIEAHHTIPIAIVDENHTTTIDKLAMLCANCHRMIHRKKDLSVEDLKNLIGIRV
jgi:hypothetical protein